MKVSLRWKTLLLVAMAIIWSLGFLVTIQPFPVAYDVAFHVRYLKDFSQAFFEGNGFPDWDARPYGGKGTAAFRYYAPSTYVLGALCMRAGFSETDALKIVLIAFSLLGAWGVRRWLDGMEAEEASGLAVFLFLGSPILAAHIYQMFFFQNICAVLLFPCIFDGWIRGRKGFAGTAQAGFFLGLAGFTHLPATMMAGYALLIISVLEALFQRRFAPVVRAGTIIVLAGSLMAPYALQSFGTLEEISFGRLDIVTPWCRHDFLDEPPILNPENPLWEAIRQVFSFCLVLLLFATAPGAFFAWKDKIRRNDFFIFAITAGCLIFLTIRPSLILWEVIPKLAILQFPWRWLFPAYLLLLPMICSTHLGTSENRIQSLLKASGYFGMVILLALGMSIQAYRKPLTEIDKIHTIFFYYPPEYLPASCAEPDPPPKAGPVRQANLISRFAKIISEKHAFGSSEWTCEIATRSAILEIETHWDPSWRLSLDDTPVAPACLRRCGIIGTIIPSGIHRVRIFRATPPERTAGWLFFIIVWALYGFSAWKKKRSDSDIPSDCPSEKQP